MTNKEKATIKAEHQITIGDLRRELEIYGDDCVIYFGDENSEMFFDRIKTRGRDTKTDKPNLVSIGFSTLDLVTQMAKIVAIETDESS